MTLAELIAECPPEWQWFTEHGMDDGQDSVWMHTHLGPNHDWCVWTDGTGGEEPSWSTTAGPWRPHHIGHLSEAFRCPAMKYTSAERAREGHIEACFAWARKAREDEEETDGNH